MSCRGTILRCTLLLALLVSCQSGNDGALDLSGPWRFIPDAGPDNPGLSGELLIKAPSNLRRTLPHFNGAASLVREFEWSSESNHSLRLLIGGVGSVDRLFLNGVEIGGHGAAHKHGYFRSSWNTVRYYSIPAGLLKAQNTIRIHFVSIDVKSGIHRGPVLLGKSSDLDATYWLLSFFYDTLFQAETVILFFLFGFFLVTMPFRSRERGFLYIAFAFLAYAIHSLYYIELPVAVPYLWFLKVQWIARIFSSQLTFLFFLRTTYLGSRRLDLSLWIPLGIFSVWTLFAPDFDHYFLVAQLTQLYFCIMVFAHCLHFWLNRSEGDAAQIKTIVVAVPIVLFSYVSDLFLRLYWNDWVFLYHYVALFNVLQFLVLYSLTLFAFKEAANRWRLRLAEQRLLLSRELHDSIGADIHEISVHAGHLGSDSAAAKSIQTLTRNVIHEMSEIVEFMRMPSSPSDAFYLHIERVSDRLANSGVCEVQASISDFTLPSDFQEFQMKRIFSEWITNVLRHSQPSMLRIRWNKRRRACSLIIADNGTGLSWTGQAMGSGLANIARRAQSMRGSVRSFMMQSVNVFVCRVPLDEWDGSSLASGED